MNEASRSKETVGISDNIVIIIILGMTDTLIMSYVHSHNVKLICIHL